MVAEMRGQAASFFTLDSKFRLGGKQSPLPLTGETPGRWTV